MFGLDGPRLPRVPAGPRGAPSQPRALGARTAKPFIVPHLPQRSTIMADSVQGARLFGAAPAADAAGSPLDLAANAVRAKINALQAVHRRDIDYTIEYHRLGAVRGLILDADGSTLFDLYSEFGVTQQAIAFALGTAGTNIAGKANQVLRLIDQQLGGVAYDHVHVFAGSSWFDDFTGHAKVEKAFENYQNGAFLRTDKRRGFEFGGLVIEEYAGRVNGADLIDPNEAYAFPVGVPGMFITRFAPADYIETVNTVGLPYYSKQQAMDFNKGIQLESQSKPLNLTQRPGPVIKLTK